MISMRQHAISLIAVFLALIVGLFLGSGFLRDRVNSVTDAQQDRIDTLTAERDSLSEQLNTANGFQEAIAGRLIAGTLDGQSVLVVSSPNASDDDVDAVKRGINQAGGGFAGQLALTPKLLKDQDAAALNSTINSSIPAGTQLRVENVDSGARLGDLLGAVILHRDGERPAPAADRDTALQALRAGGFIDFADGVVKPADLVVVVTGGELPADAGAQGRLVGRLATSMAMRGQGGVLAGRTGSAIGGSPIAVVRSDPLLGNAVSTVDNVNQQTGRLTVILALGEERHSRTGAYGNGPGAQSITVEAPA